MKVYQLIDLLSKYHLNDNIMCNILSEDGTPKLGILSVDTIMTTPRLTLQPVNCGTLTNSEEKET